MVCNPGIDANGVICNLTLRIKYYLKVNDRYLGDNPLNFFQKLNFGF